MLGPIDGYPQAVATTANVPVHHVPPQAGQAQRFLARRGWIAGQLTTRQQRWRADLRAGPQTAALAGTWEPLGPVAVVSQNFGLVTGRVTAVAFDPSDATGNRVLVGTTGGGVWLAQNAATTNGANVTFAPLTDGVAAMVDTSALDATISIGALTVQPGGTGVILAGTGDPNDALDSYYGAGILRSADGGNTWSLIQDTSDVIGGEAVQDYALLGEGIAGFAWSTANPQVVVAAVAQAYESTLVDAEWADFSCSGLYYSDDSGATWHFARITDGSGRDVQGPMDAFVEPSGNSATSVVWNPVRRVFIAAVRYHGYYQSPDGVVWTRLTEQPGTNLTPSLCPTNSTQLGSPACPIFRGTVAVNPLTGDTFAWSVDEDNQDQGLWQDVCAASSGVCANAVGFTQRWSTAALETDELDEGAATILNGDYNLALAAVPSNQDTLLMAGANDLWKCSLATGCTWRNTTNTTTCISAQVGEFQHAVAWNLTNPLEVFFGNDSGLWRSLDAVGETGPACSATDVTHFQNLNGGIGSLAEIESLSATASSSYTTMAGLGANGTAGVKSTTGPTTNWPEILGGEGGPVAIDPTNANNWYVNNAAGVSIRLCAEAGACTPAEFGAYPVVSDADVSGDGLVMSVPAAFLVDPLDATQLLIGTCRVWRGPASGVGWNLANAVSPMLDGNTGSPSCDGNSLIRSLAAQRLAGGGEVVYAGTYGWQNGGATLPGHVVKATLAANGTWSAWQDLTASPTIDDGLAFNSYELDISSLTIDPHDPTGKTVYVTVAGFPQQKQSVRTVYGSTDGGAHWINMLSNLPFAPANSAIVDPADPATLYVATDVGVWATRAVASCGVLASNCWAPLGAGLPQAPVVELISTSATANPAVLVAATYGRGLWQIPLLTAGTQLATVTVNHEALTFATTQAQGTTSPAQAVTLTNTSAIALLPTSVAMSGDFTETDDCAGSTINANALCTIEVSFAPVATGARSGQLIIGGNIAGGSITLNLNGTGGPPSLVLLTPSAVNFGNVESGTTSPSLQITVQNSSQAVIPISSLTVSSPFVLASNSCGTVALVPTSDCSLTIEFSPTTAGSATGTLTMVDGVGTQIAYLAGVGTSPPTDTLSATFLTFPGTILATTSAALTVTVTNSGGNPLTAIAPSTTGPFQVTSTCTTQLAAQSSCGLSVVYLPTAAGLQSGTLLVSDAMRTQTVPLAGTGLLPPAFTVNPTSLTFSNQAIGVASAPATLTLTNSGGAPMANVGFQITGAGASSFAVGATTCGAILANGSQCTVQVVFTPAAAGLAAATLVLSTATAAGPKPVTASVPLNGTGQTANALVASPAQLTFAPQSLGQASAPQTVTIVNSSASVAAGLSLTTTGAFSLTQNSCPASLGSAATCTTGVIFQPMQSGALNGALAISAVSGPSPATVALSGTGGLTSTLQLVPSLVNFPTTGVGVASSAVAIAVTNTSTTIPLDSLTVTASSGFVVAANTCGATIAPSATCSVSVGFAPTLAGAQTGMLSFGASTLSATATVPLSGVGFDFTAVIAGANTQSVASGQSANYTLTLTPSLGSSASFAFQCSSLPSYAGCVYNPVTNMVAANSTGTESIVVTTSQATAALKRPHRSSGSRLLVLACGFCLLPFALRKRSRLFLLTAMLAVLLGTVASCSSSGGGGGGGGGSSSSDTPAGTYAIPIAITANGVAHSVTVTLVVD